MVIATGPRIVAPSTAPKTVLAQARELQVKMVDFKFIDLPGLWQHFSIPVEELVEDLFPAGVFTVLPGTGPGAGQQLSQHADVDLVMFTGSARVGSCTV